MDDLRVGLAFRSVRIKRGLRQVDVAGLAGVSSSTVSRIERGHFGSISLDAIRSVARVLEIRVEMVARWKAGELDRLLNARHSNLHELVAQMFAQLPGWVARPEVSFAIFGERGVVDILAWHPGARMLLVIELKTDIVDVNDLVGGVDRKRRHAIQIATDLGWIKRGDPPVAVSTWILVADGSTNRRRVQAHRTMLRSAFPADGRTMAGWLRHPRGPIGALSFWANADRGPRGARLTPPRRVSAKSRRAG